MAKFNVIQKQRRAKVQERKRAVHVEPNTGKLRVQTPPVSISGKHKQKLFKKWRREQKEALEKGLVMMEDVEMAVAEGSQGTSKKPQVKLHLKNRSKLKLLRLGGKGFKSKRKSFKLSTSAPVDAMLE